MSCPKCGAPKAADAAFCNACGSTLYPGTSDASHFPALPPRPATGPQPTTAPGKPDTGMLRAASAPTELPAAAAEAPSGYLPAGTVVDQKYVIERVLGEGGMGVVYLARDVNTGVDVVVKSVLAEIAHRPDVRERMLSEGRALARIDHPNVVRLNAVVPEGTGLWLVMQYIEGESLEGRIQAHAAKNERMPVDEVVRIFRQICLGISAAHREGLIHRDLKPANVLMRRKDGVAKVADFGIAKTEEDAQAGRGQTRGIVGSLWYMSPEQVHGRRDLDKRVDIYALGIVLYEMLIGRVPFDSESQYEVMAMQAKDLVPPARASRLDVPDALDVIIQKCTAKDRDHRYASCEELLAAIDVAFPALATSTGAMAATPTPGYAAPVAVTPYPGYAGHGMTPMGMAPVMTAPMPMVATTTGGAALPGPYPMVGAPPAQRPSGGAAGAIIAGVVVLVLAVGGFGAYSLMKPKPAASEDDDTPVIAVDNDKDDKDDPPVDSAKPSSPLAGLVGRWSSENGRVFDAALVGDSLLEFRIVSPEQFRPLDYREGEARFIVRSNATGALSVEDRVRPTPPGNKTFDPRSRNTCLATVTEIGGVPLSASAVGDVLVVELAIADYPVSIFTLEGSSVVGCIGFDRLKPRKITFKLNRSR